MSVQSLTAYLGSAWLCFSCTSRHSASIDPSQVYNQRGWSHIMKQASPCWAEAFLALSEGDASHQLLGTAAVLSSPNPFMPSQSGHLWKILSGKIWLLVDKTLTSLNLKWKIFFRRRSPCGSWKVWSTNCSLLICSQKVFWLLFDWLHSTVPCKN